MSWQANERSFKRKIRWDVCVRRMRLFKWKFVQICQPSWRLGRVSKTMKNHEKNNNFRQMQWKRVRTSRHWFKYSQQRKRLYNNRTHYTMYSSVWFCAKFLPYCLQWPFKHTETCKWKNQSDENLDMQAYAYVFISGIVSFHHKRKLSKLAFTQISRHTKYWIGFYSIDDIMNNVLWSRNSKLCKSNHGTSMQFL